MFSRFWSRTHQPHRSRGKSRRRPQLQRANAVFWGLLGGVTPRFAGHASICPPRTGASGPADRVTTRRRCCGRASFSQLDRRGAGIRGLCRRFPGTAPPWPQRAANSRSACGQILPPEPATQAPTPARDPVQDFFAGGAKDLPLSGTCSRTWPRARRAAKQNLPWQPRPERGRSENASQFPELVPAWQIGELALEALLKHLADKARNLLPLRSARSPPRWPAQTPCPPGRKTRSG